jgi:hypothetical protein
MRMPGPSPSCLCLSNVVHCSCNRSHQEQDSIALKPNGPSPDKECKKTFTHERLL